MNAFVMLMIVVVTTAGYMVDIGLLPRVAKFLPEILSGIALLIVIALGAHVRFRFVRPAYWFAFGAVALIMVCGALANSLESGPLFAGLRTYLRAVPFFFLPSVYAFNERQVRNQLMLLLVLCLLQLPLAIYQRMHTLSSGSGTGDTTMGTLQGSGLLSVFLISALCILTAKLLRREIKGLHFLLLFVWLLLPTTINETKATVFLLPVGILTTLIAGSKRGSRLKNAIVATSLLALSSAIFVPLYDYYIEQRSILYGKHAPSIVDFFSEKGKFQTYVTKGAGATIGAPHVGRLDSIVVPLREMSRDPVHAAFGLGIGNVTDSSLGLHFSGKYFYMFEPFLGPAATLFILEIGLLGLFLVLVIDFLIYRDSRAVAATEDGAMAAFALGWAGVTAVIVTAGFYAPLPASEAISYLFFYFSGVVAAHRARYSMHGASRPALEK